MAKGGERKMHKCLKSLAAVSFIALAACHTTQNTTPDANPVGLAGTSWRLVALQSSDDAIGMAHPDDPAKYQLTFGADGRVAARLDCNRGSAAYSQATTDKEKGALNIGPMVMTRVLCPPGSLDTRISRELSFVRTYLLKGDRLTLVMMADSGTQIWQRAVTAKNGG
jgi:heat shock protein HslJ